ncbi:DeoR/GlpR family DNA-binding transcription regulator [soil metagenome]
MIKAERHDRIMSELARRGAISALELGEIMAASIATVRRDIAELDENGVVVRTHGGVTLRSQLDEPQYASKVMAFLPEKRRIGALAASALAANQTIGCGGGTTVMQMIMAIKRMQLRVVTTAINVALELLGSPGIEVVVTGGTLRGRTAELVGHIAESTLAAVNLDVAVIGVDGFDVDGGLTTYDFAEAHVNSVLVNRARAVWVLADASKLGIVRPAVIAPCSKVTRLITDTSASTVMTRSIARLGITVLRA